MSVLARLRRLGRPPAADDRERRLDYLRSAGAEQVEHSGEHLLDHLVATSDLLASWGARPALCDAALFHSVYGTEFLREQVVGSDRRAEVRALIGDEAERLAWLWHAVRRDTLLESLGRGEDLRVELREGGTRSVTRQQVEDLLNLWLADAVEQMPRRERESAERHRLRFAPFLEVAMPEAAAAARESFRRYAGAS